MTDGTQSNPIRMKQWIYYRSIDLPAAQLRLSCHTVIASEPASGCGQRGVSEVPLRRRRQTSAAAMKVCEDCRAVTANYGTSGDKRWCAVCAKKDGRHGECGPAATAGPPRRAVAAAAAPRGAAAAAETCASESCVVCLEALSGSRPTATLSCKHVFHLDCIGNTWNAAKGSSSACPMWRIEQPLEWKSGADFQASERAAIQRETQELQREALELQRQAGIAPLPAAAGADESNGAEGQADDELHDDVCRLCSTGGQLLLCEDPSCTRSMHLSCAGLSEIPRGFWHCPWCVLDRCEDGQPPPVAAPAARPARAPRAQRARSESPGDAPAVVKEFVPERRSSRQERAARRKEGGRPDAAFRALRRRRVLRENLEDMPSDEEDGDDDESEGETTSADNSNEAAAATSRQRRSKRPRVPVISDDEEEDDDDDDDDDDDGTSSSSSDDDGDSESFFENMFEKSIEKSIADPKSSPVFGGAFDASNAHARERAAAAAEARQISPAGMDNTAWADLSNDEQQATQDMLAEAGESAAQQERAGKKRARAKKRARSNKHAAATAARVKKAPRCEEVVKKAVAAPADWCPLEEAPEDMAAFRFVTGTSGPIGANAAVSLSPK